MMKTDEELKNDVQNAIKNEIFLHSSGITVSVEDGVVTLAGNVSSYSKKKLAKAVVENITGVKSLVEKFEVKLDLSQITKDDLEMIDEYLKNYGIIYWL